MATGEVRNIKVVGGRVERFTSYSDVADYLGKRVANRFAVVEPLERPLIASLEGPRGMDEQSVTLVSGHQRIVLPRRTSTRKEGISVSTSPEPDLDIIYHPEEWDSRLLDRGLGWIRVSSNNPEMAHVHLTVVPEHELSSDELAGRLQAAVDRARELVDAVFDGSDPLPWVDRSAYSDQVVERQQAAQHEVWEARRQQAFYN